MNVVQTLRRMVLRAQGIDPEELEEELGRMDAAKRRREAERRAAEREASRIFVRGIAGRRDAKH